MNLNVKLYQFSIGYLRSLESDRKVDFIQIFKAITSPFPVFNSLPLKSIILKLDSVVLNNSDDDNTSILKWIYKSSKNVSIFVDNLLYVLTIIVRNDNFDSKLPAHEKRARQYFLIQTYHLLVSRKVNSNFCEDIMKVSNELSINDGFLDVSIISNLNLLHIYSSRKNIIKVNTYKDKYYESLDLFIEFNKLVFYVEDLALRYNFSIYYYLNHLDDIEAYIDVYSNSKYDNNLPVLFYRSLLELTFLYVKGGDYSLSIKNFKDILESIYKIDRRLYFEGYLNIANHYLLLGKWNSFSLLSYQYINNPLIPSAIRLNFIILNYIYSLHINDFKSLDSLGHLISTFHNVSYFTNYQPLIAFLYANYCHLKNDFKQSILSLQDASSLISDKSGYGLGIRILELMNFIRWSKHEQMESALINLKNQITFLKKSGTIKPRFIYIYKILTKLHSAHYDYEKCYRLFYEELKLMASADPHWRWDIRSPEVIRFDTWFFSNCDIIPDWDLQLPDPTKNPDV